MRLAIVVALALLAGLHVTAGATAITAVSPSHAHRAATTGLTAAAADTQASKSARTTPLLNARITALLARPSLRTVPRSLTSSFSLGRATKAGAEAGRATRFVTTPRGTTFDIPSWAAREADNGKGIVYQRPRAEGIVDSIRIMEPTARRRRRWGTGLTRLSGRPR